MFFLAFAGLDLCTGFEVVVFCPSWADLLSDAFDSRRC